MVVIRLAEDQKSVQYTKTDWAGAQFAMTVVIFLTVLTGGGVILYLLGGVFQNTSPAQIELVENVK